MAFKICLTGCGGMASGGHGPMLKKYAAIRPGVELAACCDVNRERAEHFAAEFGFRRAFTDMEEMLETVRPDGAVLAVPIEHTMRLSVKTLERKIPLLTEKPPGATTEEGRAIAEAARKAGVPASAAFNRRTMPLIEALKKEIAAVGEPIDSVYIEMCRVNRTEPDFSMTAIHDVDLARHLCGSDYACVDFSYRVHGKAAPAADIAVQAVMESGALVSLGFFPMCGFASERVTVRLHGHLFRAELPLYGSADVPGRVVHIAGNGVAGTIHGDACDPAEANGFLGEYTSFFDAVCDGRLPEHSVEGSLQSLEVACRIGERASQYRKA